MTIAVVKSQWCRFATEIVGYLCGTDGRRLARAKVDKVLKWLRPTNVREVRGFIGVVVYYRIWIGKFATKGKPLFELTRKDVEWEWIARQEEAFEYFKESLCNASVLITIDYEDEDAPIIL